MNRRGFVGSLGALLGATMRPAPKPEPAALPVERATGKRFIVGVATETVHAGDLVQIQTYGPASVNVRP